MVKAQNDISVSRNIIFGPYKTKKKPYIVQTCIVSKFITLQYKICNILREPSLFQHGTLHFLSRK